MTLEQEDTYHALQISTFAKTDVDLGASITMTNANAVIGIARAAKAAGLPSVPHGWRACAACAPRPPYPAPDSLCPSRLSTTASTTGNRCSTLFVTSILPSAIDLPQIA